MEKDLSEGFILNSDIDDIQENIMSHVYPLLGNNCKTND
jgi:hypothetical protein